ncbi:unnamed protein product [Diamesa serratosioi]
MSKQTEQYQPYGPDFGALLPMEIIIQIFDYLHPADRFFAALTCKRFLEGCEHYYFNDDIQLNFTKTTFADHEYPAKNFLQSFRQFRSISFSDVEFGECQKFWIKLGADVENLSLTICDITERKLTLIIRQVKNLKSLKIENCRELFMSGRLFDDAMPPLESVTTLSLAQNRYLSDSLFNRIIKVIPNLESLDLSGCHISFHKGLYKKFYPASKEDEPSESVLTFHFLNKFIEREFAKIKELNFNSTLIDGNTLIMLSEVKNLKLDALHLRSCDQLTNDGIISLINVQTNLQHLDFTYSVRLTDQSLIQICKVLKNLKVLKLRRCRALTDLGVKNLIDLPHLQVLDISECESITSAGLLQGIASKNNPHIQELYVSALNICEKTIVKITENFLNLRVLDLSFCFNHLNDLGVQMIFKNLVFLRELNLDLCDKISDAGLTGLGMKDKVNDHENDDDKGENKEAAAPAGVSVVELPIQNQMINIQQVDNGIHRMKISLRTKAEEEIVKDAMRKKQMMEMCEQINFEDQDTSNYSLSRLSGLRVLKIGRCNRISDVSLIYNLRLPELKEINLSKCQQISIVGIKALVENCPSLEVIDLSECHNINDKCIELITRKLHRLTSLNIQGCHQLTDFSLDYISLYCRRIKDLNLLGCRNMSSEPNLRLSSVRTLKNISFSKPGPYVQNMAAFRPTAPPIPRLF